MEDKKTIIILCVFGALVITFLILTFISPDSLANVPILNHFVSTSTTSTTQQTQTKGSSGSSVSVSQSPVLGADGGAHSVVPVKGSTLTPKGKYSDGQFIGSAVDPSGVLVVQVTITGGAMSDISFSQSPTDIPQTVLSALAAEAKSTQTVAVSPVNGYDNGSVVFQHALAQAVQKAYKQ